MRSVSAKVPGVRLFLTCSKCDVLPGYVAMQRVQAILQNARSRDQRALEGIKAGSSTHSSLNFKGSSSDHEPRTDEPRTPAAVIVGAPYPDDESSSTRNV